MNVSPLIIPALINSEYSIISSSSERVPLNKMLSIWFNKFAGSLELVWKDWSDCPSHIPASLNSESEPTMSIEPSLASELRSITPSWLLHGALMSAVSKFLRVSGSRVRGASSLITTSLKELIWPRVKVFKPSDKFSAVSFKVTL